MSDYINREDTIKAFDPNQRRDWYTPWIVETLKDLPPADVAPVRHGHWIKDDVFGIPVYRCSVCDKEFWLSADDTPQGSSYQYCPNCGAKMDKEVLDRWKDEQKAKGEY